MAAILQNPLPSSRYECWRQIKGSAPAMVRRNTLGLGHIRGRVDVEEGIDRRRRPLGDGDPVAGGPGLDLAQAFVDHGLAQIIPQRDRPEADDRMAPIPRLRASERQTRRATRVL